MIAELLKEQSSWEKLQATTKPIILYGTGNGADMVIDELNRLRVTISAVTASEGFVRKRAFRGFTVKSLNDIEKEYKDFIIILGFATSVHDVMNSIKELSKKHQIIMPVVPVFGDAIFNRAYIENNADTLEHCRSLLFDEESKQVFDSMVRFQFTGELTCLLGAESSRTDALKNVLRLTDTEDMLDLGAYRGDTIKELIDLTGGYSSIVALEPDRKSFEKLSEFTKDMKNVTLYPYAVWSEQKKLIFSGGGGRQSTISDSGKYSVTATDIDSLTGDKTITYVKADVEGVEAEMLMGMKNLLQTQKPKLSIACYHRTEDLCTLIPLINSINPEYKIHLRHHPYIPFWDTNLYCI